MTHVLFCGSSSCVLCDFIEVKDLEETDSGAKKGQPISLCITVDQKERKKSGRRKERKCKPSTKPNKKPPKHREQREEERIFSANTCFLKNTVCVWETQSCLSAVHFKELCLVFHSSLRKHVKISPVDFSQGLTSTEVFH